jgi:nucleotide-binding universal stress UspA family protein
LIAVAARQPAADGAAWRKNELLMVVTGLSAAVGILIAAFRHHRSVITAMTTAPPPAGFLHVVVGYDGSPPAARALDTAVRLLQGRIGRIDVVYVAHLSSIAALSPGAIAQMESDFDEIEQELRASAAEQLRDRGTAWELVRRQGLIGEELIAVAAALRDTHPSHLVVIVVGSSSHAAHRVVGSVAVSLARHSPVPLLIVP